MSELFNKVAESSLVTLNLEDYFPRQEVVVFDLKEYLFMGLILKEKDFREALKNLDTSVYAGKIVAVSCSADAIIPMWANMLVAALLTPVAADVRYGTEEAVKQELLLEAIHRINPADYTDQRIVLKGCGELPVKEAAYLACTRLLQPVARSIMYGEPCSTVPIYKRKA